MSRLESTIKRYFFQRIGFQLLDYGDEEWWLSDSRPATKSETDFVRSSKSHLHYGLSLMTLSSYSSRLASRDSPIPPCSFLETSWLLVMPCCSSQGDDHCLNFQPATASALPFLSSSCIISTETKRGSVGYTPTMEPLFSGFSSFLVNSPDTPFLLSSVLSLLLSE